MPSRANLNAPSEAAGPLKAALASVLHHAYDSVLREPVPNELLVAGGLGPARWDARREERGRDRTREP